jgi:hypothetical protein
MMDVWRPLQVDIHSKKMSHKTCHHVVVRPRIARANHAPTGSILLELLYRRSYPSTQILDYKRMRCKNEDL